MTATAAAVYAASTSTALTPFLAAHEGFVSKAYRCPAGVITIGYGFTDRSKVFASYWRAKTGHALRMGDTITRAEADAVLEKMLAAEYTPPVARKLKQVTQHAFDGATSVSYNCGPGSLKWKWAQALARGDVSGAAALLKNTAVTGNGRRLAGLVRRRKEEAALILAGDYGRHGLAGVVVAVSIEPEDVRWYQEQLTKLGAYKGPIDGDRASSDISVRAFQKAQGLKVDGDVGPATRAAIIRALDAKISTKVTSGGAVAGGAAGVGEEIASMPEPATTPDAAPIDSTVTSDPSITAPPSTPELPAPPVESMTDDVAIAALVGAIAIGLLVWGGIWLFRNRGRFTGKRVPT